MIDSNAKLRSIQMPFCTVLAGYAADGGLMGYFLGMCNVVYVLGAVRNGSR